METKATWQTTTETVSRIRAQAAAEIERIDGIRRLCNGRHARIEAQAIRDGWDIQRTELQILRDNRPTAPSVHVPERTINAQVLEAACLRTAKSNSVEALYDDRTLELACLLYTSPSPRDGLLSRMPSSA